MTTANRISPPVCFHRPGRPMNIAPAPYTFPVIPTTVDWTDSSLPRSGRITML